MTLQNATRNKSYVFKIQVKLFKRLSNYHAKVMMISKIAFISVKAM